MQSQITDWGQALIASLTGALALFFNSIPKLLGFIIILAVGWVIASLAEKGCLALLRMVKFNDLSRRAGTTEFVEKMGVHADSSTLLSIIVKWFVRLIALVVAFDALGMQSISDMLRQLLLWVPNLLVALVVLVIGGLIANAMSKVVRGAATEGGVENPEFLGKVTVVAIWAFTIVVAVNQIGIATSLLNILFTAMMGAIALALGLSFGLGGRDTASEIVRKWYRKGQVSWPQVERRSTEATPIIRSDTSPQAGRRS